jgi:hypothetical protein
LLGLFITPNIKKKENVFHEPVPKKKIINMRMKASEMTMAGLAGGGGAYCQIHLLRRISTTYTPAGLALYLWTSVPQSLVA